jgi:hypothetical protein
LIAEMPVVAHLRKGQTENFCRESGKKEKNFSSTWPGTAILFPLPKGGNQSPEPK